MTEGGAGDGPGEDPPASPASAAARLQPLLAPRSIALLGASTVPDSFGWALLDMAAHGGYRGEIFPVNPRYREGLGLRFHSRLADLPAPVEHVVLAVANARLESCLLDAVDHGARAVTIFADAHGPAAGGERLADRVRAIAREAGLLVCGPNSMGFHNLDAGLRVTPFPAPRDLVPGHIGAILQSGSVMGALAHNDRRMRFGTLVSTGSEATVSAADYLLWMLEQPSTRVIALFLESVRDPEGFVRALEAAERRSIPVVVLKVGRTAASQSMAVSHTGAILGDHAVFEAVMRDHGAHLVETVDELAATALLFSQGRAAAPGALACIHDSGGERELLTDLASDLGVPLAELSPETVERIAAHLEPGLEAENPLDAWGSGKGARTTFDVAMRTMMADEAVAVGLYALDWRQDYYLHEMHERILIDVAAATPKPVAAVSNYSMSTDAVLASRLADHGVPLLEGTDEALKAVRHLLAQRDRRRRERRPHREHPRARRWRDAIAAGPCVPDALGFSMLAAYGIPVAPHAVAGDREGALARAAEIGYPVALKSARPGLAHKTEAGGVALGLAGARALGAAYDDIAARLGPEVLVCQMVAGEVEWALGVIADRDFGPAVMIAPGGVQVELLGERAVLIAPFGPEEAAEAIRGLRAFRLLEGYRGRAPLAAGALCDVAARVSRIAVDLRGVLAEMDINPVRVSRTGAVAVDVLVRGR